MGDTMKKLCKPTFEKKDHGRGAGINGLPNPQEFGNFNVYQAVSFIPGVITWQWVLESTSETFPTWFGTFTEITAELTSNTVKNTPC